MRAIWAPDSFGRDDLLAVSGAQRHQTTIHGSIPNSIRFWPEFGNDHTTRATPALATPVLDARVAAMAQKTQKRAFGIHVVTCHVHILLIDIELKTRRCWLLTFKRHIRYLCSLIVHFYFNFFFVAFKK